MRQELRRNRGPLMPHAETPAVPNAEQHRRQFSAIRILVGARKLRRGEARQADAQQVNASGAFAHAHRIRRLHHCASGATTPPTPIRARPTVSEAPVQREFFHEDSCRPQTGRQLQPMRQNPDDYTNYAYRPQAGRTDAIGRKSRASDHAPARRSQSAESPAYCGLDVRCQPPQ